MTLLEAAWSRSRLPFQCKRKDGKPIWISVSEKKSVTNGRTICYQGFDEDITEQKRLEAASHQLPRVGTAQRN